MKSRTLLPLLLLMLVHASTAYAAGDFVSVGPLSDDVTLVQGDLAASEEIFIVTKNCTCTITLPSPPSPVMTRFITVVHEGSGSFTVVEGTNVIADQYTTRARFGLHAGTRKWYYTG